MGTSGCVVFLENQELWK